jgi:hypothetical protein
LYVRIYKWERGREDGGGREGVEGGENEIGRDRRYIMAREVSFKK